MNFYLINQFLFPFFCIIFLTSILGYGNFFSKFFYLDKNLICLKNIFFIQGLILISFFSIIINIFFPISNLVTLFIVSGGLVLYLYYYFKSQNKLDEIIFLTSVVILSFIFAFYAGVSDDFLYHYNTIKNYKNYNIFEISHHRMISYNSNWLFLNSIFSIDFIYSSIFVLSSLIYGILIYDTYNLYINSFRNKNFYVGTISFYIFIFFLGVLNKFKDFGTDTPGAIISFYILIILIYALFDKKIKNNNNILILVLPLVFFAFVIKITNSLVFLYLLLLISTINLRALNFKFIFIISIFPLLWFFQNYNISGCLIWPIEITCFSNNESAKNEFYLIESFAKGDINTQINTSGFSWIYIWLENHSKKLIETYLVFTLVILLPIIYTFFRNKENRSILLFSFNELFKSSYFISLFLTIIVSNLIWFFYTPAYRFGVFYNFCLISFLVLPQWIKLLKINFNFVVRYCKVITLIIFIYFIAVNINKINWYSERFDIWPPIKNDNVISRKAS